MLDQILAAIVGDISALNLQLGGTTVTVVKRKGTKREPGVDQSNQITVCKAEKPERVLYLAFGQITPTYAIEITIVDPNNRDWTSNLATYAQWRETIRNQYLPPKLVTTSLWNCTDGTGKVWGVRVRPDKYLDRATMANLYDEQTLYLDVMATN